MATYSKPAKVPRWNDTGANRTEPPSGKKDTGWLFGEVPPSSYENWRTNLIGEWVKWLDERLLDGSTDDEFVVQAPIDFKVLGGDGATPGNLYLWAGNATPDNTDGGGLDISTGSAVGAGSASITMQAVDGGQAPGSAIRISSEYLKLDGANRQVKASRAFLATVPSGSLAAVEGDATSGSGIGVIGKSSSNHGVVAEGDTTSPAKSSLRLLPQDADPSSGVVGDVYINSITRGIRQYVGNSDWAKLNPFHFALAQDGAGDAITGTTSETAFATTYVIPANTLVVGSVVTVEWMVNSLGDPGTYRVEFAGSPNSWNVSSFVTTADGFLCRAVFIVRSVGSAGVAGGYVLSLNNDSGLLGAQSQIKGVAGDSVSTDNDLTIRMLVTPALVTDTHQLLSMTVRVA